MRACAGIHSPKFPNWVSRPLFSDPTLCAPSRVADGCQPADEVLSFSGQSAQWEAIGVGNLFRSCPCSSDIITSRRGKWVQDREVLLASLFILERTTTQTSNIVTPPNVACDGPQNRALSAHTLVSRGSTSISSSDTQRNRRTGTASVEIDGGGEDRSRISTNRTDRPSYLPIRTQLESYPNRHSKPHVFSSSTTSHSTEP